MHISLSLSLFLSLFSSQGPFFSFLVTVSCQRTGVNTAEMLGSDYTAMCQSTSILSTKEEIV